MIEIVFNDSTAGSLQSANNINKTNNDIFSFYLSLSIGDISSGNFIKYRADTVANLWSIYPNMPKNYNYNIFENFSKSFTDLQNKINNQTKIRIWYSDNPDDMCGLYWFLSEILNFKTQPKAIYILKLPKYEYKENNTINGYSSWSAVSPDKLYSYTKYQEEITDVFKKMCMVNWRNLQKENSSLRAVLNGNLQSVAEDIYDSFIYRAIANQNDEFNEAHLIGMILGEYNLGVSDAFLHKRIEKIILKGELEIISQSFENSPVYHRMLRKTR